MAWLIPVVRLFIRLYTISTASYLSDDRAGCLTCREFISTSSSAYPLLISRIGRTRSLAWLSTTSEAFGIQNLKANFFAVSGPDAVTSADGSPPAMKKASAVGVANPAAGPGSPFSDSSHAASSPMKPAFTAISYADRPGFPGRPGVPGRPGSPCNDSTHSDSDPIYPVSTADW